MSSSIRLAFGVDKHSDFWYKRGMLKALRKQTKFFVWIAAASFIGLIFLRWGMNVTGRTRRTPQESGVIGEVNGEPITAPEYRSEIERQSALEGERFGLAELSEEAKEDIYDRAFDAIVSRKLLQQEVVRRGITITDEEVLNVIRYSPPQEFLEADTFQTDGEFDLQKWYQFIKDPQSFQFLLGYESRIRENLPLQKLQFLIFSSAKVTESEVREEYVRRTESATVEYLFVPVDTSSEIDLTDDELAEYYSEHSEELLDPEKAMISYVFFENTPSQHDEDLVRERIEEIRTEALESEDFAEVCSYYSEDPASASLGGDLGWIEKGTMLPEFDEVVFSLHSGDISEPFRTAYGWHVAKVTGRRGNKVRVSHILLKVRPSSETIDTLRMNIRGFRDAAKKEGFEEAALKQGLEVYTTNEFPLDTEYVPGLGVSKEAHKIIVENGVGEVSYPIAKGNRYYVFKIVRKERSRLPPLAEIRSLVQGRLTLEKRKAEAGQRAREIYQAAVGGQSMASAARPFDLTPRRTESFTRVSDISEISSDARFAGAAFSLEEGEISAPVESDLGWFVIKMLARETADDEGFAEEGGLISSQLLQREQRELFNSWVESLKAEATVKDYRRQLL